MHSMSWVFRGVMKRARDFEREQARRLNEAYALWRKKLSEKGLEQPLEPPLLALRAAK
jgi:hypothetical protein